MRHLLLAAALAFGLAGAAQAGPAEDEAGLAALRAADTRLAAIAYRLTVANAALCAVTAPVTGLRLHAAAQYNARFRAAAVRLFGLGDGPAILAVAPDSPAEAAGLRAGDWLVAIGDGAVAASTTADAAATGLEAALARGPVDVTVVRDGRRLTVPLVGRTGCAADVVLNTAGGFNAEADGRRILIGAGLASYVASDDEFAAVVGHELAHNALGHRARLDAEGAGHGLSRMVGRGAALVRRTEREADYLSLYLMARAGYDVHAASAFWSRFGREHGPGPFGTSDHPSWRKRTRDLDRAAGEIDGKRVRGEPLLPGTLWPEGE